jgi:hypothetical protein
MGLTTNERNDQHTTVMNTQERNPKPATPDKPEGPRPAPVGASTAADPKPLKEGPQPNADDLPEKGDGGAYEKEGPKPSKGSEMPEIPERTGKETPRSRIAVLHDPESDAKDLDEYTERVSSEDGGLAEDEPDEEKRA